MAVFGQLIYLGSRVIVFQDLCGSGDSGIISKSILNMGLVNSIFRLVQDIDRLTG